MKQCSEAQEDVCCLKCVHNLGRATVESRGRGYRLRRGVSLGQGLETSIAGIPITCNNKSADEDHKQPRLNFPETGASPSQPLCLKFLSDPSTGGNCLRRLNPRCSRQPEGFKYPITRYPSPPRTYYLGTGALKGPLRAYYLVLGGPGVSTQHHKYARNTLHLDTLHP